MWIGFLKTYHATQTTPVITMQKFIAGKRAAYKWFNKDEALDDKIVRLVKVLYDVPDELLLPDDVIMSLRLPVRKDELYEAFCAIHSVGKKYVILPK